MLNQIVNSISTIKTMLDVDAYLCHNETLDFFEPRNLKIDLICRDSISPILENIYTRQFKSIEEVELRFYDLILLTAERSIDEWIAILNWAVESWSF